MGNSGRNSDLRAGKRGSRVAGRGPQQKGRREQKGKGKIEERARGATGMGVGGREGSRRERERRPGELRGPAVGWRAKSFLSRFLEVGGGSPPR